MRAKGQLLIAAAISVALVLVVSAGAARTAVVDPSFAPGNAFDAGLGPTDVAVADFDGDHHPDLAVANCVDADTDNGELKASEVKLLFGDGSGGFRPGMPPPLPPAELTCSLASADFNGDGAPDLAVAISSGTSLAVLLNDGTGRFTAAPSSPVPLPGTPVGVVPADLTGEGHADLIVQVTGGFDVLLGDGSGGFAQAPDSPISLGANAVSVGDLDGDGKPDLAVAQAQANQIVLLRGDGAGRFAAPVQVASGGSPHALAIGDFDGNGKPDLAAIVSKGVAILLGDGTGSFHAAPGSPYQDYGDTLVVTDLNGDGRSDVATSTSDIDGVYVKVSSSRGALRRPPYSPFPVVYPLQLATADFNGDGRSDIAVLTSQPLQWPVGARGSVVLLRTADTPRPEPGHALRRPRDVVFTMRWQISALAADGELAAVCAGGVPYAWSAAHRSSTRFKVDFNSGGCYSDVAVAGDHVAYTESYCGNNECDSVLYVARFSGGRRRAVDDQANDCGAGDCYPTGVWVAQVLGGGPLIGWNDWTVECVSYCNEGEEPLARYRITSQELRNFYGGRAGGVRNDSAAHPLMAVGGGRMALEVGGSVVVLKPNGARVSSVAAPIVEGVALSRTELGVAEPTAVRLYNPTTGHLRKTIQLGPSATLQFVGINSHVALLRGDHTLVVVRLSDGKQVSFPLKAVAAKRLVGAQLTAAGLFYAYNARPSSQGRVVFEPMSTLRARF